MIEHRKHYEQLIKPHQPIDAILKTEPNHQNILYYETIDGNNR